MQIWTRKQHPANFVGMKARASRKIEQSPMAHSPDVPRGTVGWIQDYDGAEGLYFVDFGDPYGVVAVVPEEITLV